MMKNIQIKLTEAEYNGIKQYLLEDDDIVTVSDVRRYVQNIVSSVINSPREAVSGYIDQANSGQAEPEPNDDFLNRMEDIKNGNQHQFD